MNIITAPLVDICFSSSEQKIHKISSLHLYIKSVIIRNVQFLYIFLFSLEDYVYKNLISNTYQVNLIYSITDTQLYHLCLWHLQY